MIIFEFLIVSQLKIKLVLFLDLGIIGTKLKAVVITHYGNGATYLTALAVTNFLREGKTPIVIELSPLNRNLFESFISERGFNPEEVILKKELSISSHFPTIIYSVGFDLRPLSAELGKNSHTISFIATHVGTSIGLIIKARVFTLKLLRNNIFVLEDKHSREKIYLEMNQLKIIEIEHVDRMINLEAYRILLDSMAEYGELSTTDAVLILQGNFKITKEEARRILHDLLKEGKLKIEKGKLKLK